MNEKNKMRSKVLSSISIFVVIGVSLVVSSFQVTSGQQSTRPDGMRFVPDVSGQFGALTERGEPLAMWRGASPNPNPCRHYQAIQRVDGPDGTPYFFMTRSGNLPDIFLNDIICFGSDGDRFNGTFIVFRMGSRDKNGERLRSNRLAKGEHVNDTRPPLEDRSPTYFTVVGGNSSDPDPTKRPGLVFQDGPDPNTAPPPRVYQHPGGMQAIGNVLVVAAEHPRDPLGECRMSCNLYPSGSLRDACNLACDATIRYEKAPDPTQILFLDVTDPENPSVLSKFAPYKIENGERKPLTGADGLGITAMPNGRYLLSVFGGFSVGDQVYFYRSTLANSETSPNVLKRQDLDWELVGQDNGPTQVDDPHQTFQLIRQGDINGPLFLAGARGLYEGHPFYDESHERIDLYPLSSDTPNFEPGGWINIAPAVRFGKRVTPFPNTGGSRLGNLAAASGFYVSPSGELIFYSSQHDNQGPDATATLGEWRHIGVVRPGSPTLLPTAKVDGPYEIDEGSSVNLTGMAGPPITKAFLQLYHDTGFKTFSPIVDYEDRNKDNFDNFFALEFQFRFPDPPFHHADRARSWTWYAPSGCTIEAIDRDEDGNVQSTKTLTNADAGGIPEVQYVSDLTTVQNDAGSGDMNAKIDGVSFKPDCDSYYSGPFNLYWDLDRDGTFESIGNSVTFGTSAIDGPAVVDVPAQARHASGGSVGAGQARISIRNVSPAIGPLGVIDISGNQIGTTVPFVLKGSPVIFSAGFVDPGILDHQTATIDWGDGVVQNNGAFTVFDEAFGDGVGALAHSHIYQSSGTFTIAAVVTDDDGGTNTESLSLKVLTPEQAVAEMVAMLDAAIASCPNTAVCADLRHARIALAGSNPDNIKGALKMISAGDRPSAQAFLQTAGTWLARATADGATNLGALQALVLQVSAALDQ